MFLSKISIHSCVIIHYILEETIFAVVVCQLSEQQKNHNVLLKIALKLMVKKTIKMPKKDDFIKLKTFWRKIKSPFMIYANFKSSLVPEDNGKQNPNESYTNKY